MNDRDKSSHDSDHDWSDVIPGEVLALYSHYRRDAFIGPKVALLAIDLYELAYEGGARPISEIAADFPSSCGINAWKAIEPTKELLAAARAINLPVFYSTNDTSPQARPAGVAATKRRKTVAAEKYRITSALAPHPEDVVIRKQRASAFFGTPLAAHLTQLGIDTVIIFGQSTSGCVRASVVDGFSHGFNMIIAEQCCFDRSWISHRVSLFDLHHKYADVIKTGRLVAELESRAQKGA